MKDDHGAPRRPVLLIILDGFGANPSKQQNGIVEAKTPRLDKYFANYPHTVLQASGLAVGVPDGQMGNSEVGHMTLGCGSVVRQDLVKINDAIADGSFYENEVLLAAMKRAADADRPIHLMGLVSDGGVHSHVDHLLALVRLAKRCRARPLVHVITDGRDTPPRFALEYLGANRGGVSRPSVITCTRGRARHRLASLTRASRWSTWECTPPSDTNPIRCIGLSASAARFIAASSTSFSKKLPSAMASLIFTRSCRTTEPQPRVM